jgi:hypothetical protein
MDEFLNPRSMLTPGLAGGMVMMVTNALYKQFDALPHVLPPPCMAISLSLVLGLLGIYAGVAPRWKKLVYYVFNSLVIFSVAAGFNTVGSAVTDPPKQTGPVAFIGISTAYAQSRDDGAVSTDNKPQHSLPKLERERRPHTAYAGDIGRAEIHIEAPGAPPREPKPPQKERRFFTPWF